MLLNNWQELMPEIYLALVITFLLGYGVFFVKFNINFNAICTEENPILSNKCKSFIPGKYNLFKHFNYLCLFVLFWTFLLLFSLNNTLIYIGDVLFIDTFSIYIKFIVLFSTLLIFFVSINLYPQYKISDYEFSLLFLLSLLGIFLIISARDLIIMYLAIETLSLSLYVLAASGSGSGLMKSFKGHFDSSVIRASSFSSEAGLKYFVLGALGSGLLLFGCALIYFSTGLTNFDALTNLIYLNYFDNALLIGAIFLIISLLFKLAAAPFHMWAPDVYEGSPTVVTIFFAVVPKIAILYLLYKLLYGPFIGIFYPGDLNIFGVSGTYIQLLLLISGVLSIFIGTFAAIYQNRIVRLMAFSAIAHIGFILLGFATGSFTSFYSSFIYIIIYIFMTLNSFTFILSVYPANQHKYFADLLAFAKYQPILAITFTFTLLSIAGIPPLAGFFSKFYILLSLIDHQFLITAIIIVLLSVISAYYYIRIIQWMYFKNASPFNFLNTITSSITISLPQALILGASLYFILTFLIYPKPILLLTFDFFINSII